MASSNINLPEQWRINGNAPHGIIALEYQGNIEHQFLTLEDYQRIIETFNDTSIRDHFLRLEAQELSPELYTHLLTKDRIFSKKFSEDFKRIYFNKRSYSNPKFFVNEKSQLVFKMDGDFEEFMKEDKACFEKNFYQSLYDYYQQAKGCIEEKAECPQKISDRIYFLMAEKLIQQQDTPKQAIFEYEKGSVVVVLSFLTIGAFVSLGVGFFWVIKHLIDRHQQQQIFIRDQHGGRIIIQQPIHPREPREPREQGILDLCNIF